MSEEPPQHKLCYTPIAVLEEKKMNAAKKSGYVSSTSKAKGSTAREATDNDDAEKSPVDDTFTEGTQTSAKSGAAINSKNLNRSPMDLDLSLNGHDSDNDSDGENKELDWGTERPTRTEH